MRSSRSLRLFCGGSAALGLAQDLLPQGLGHPPWRTGISVAPEKSSKAGVKPKEEAHMAVREDLNSERKSGGADELPIFNADNLQSNVKAIYYSRTFLSIIGGVVAGVWGFTGLTGFIFYFLIMGITSLGLAAKAKFSVQAYFDSWNRIVLDGLFGGLMVFSVGC